MANVEVPVAAISVTVNKEKVTDTSETKAKVGDVIRVAVGIDKNTRFRDGMMQIAIATSDDAETEKFAAATTFLSKDFNELDISDAAGRFVGCLFDREGRDI